MYYVQMAKNLESLTNANPMNVWEPFTSGQNLNKCKAHESLTNKVAKTFTNGNHILDKRKSHERLTALHKWPKPSQMAITWILDKRKSHERLRTLHKWAFTNGNHMNPWQMQIPWMPEHNCVWSSWETNTSRIRCSCLSNCCLPIRSYFIKIMCNVWQLC